jgi:hypothetical protein
MTKDSGTDYEILYDVLFQRGRATKPAILMGGAGRNGQRKSFSAFCLQGGPRGRRPEAGHLTSPGQDG